MAVTVEVKDLNFSFPGIDGNPAPQSKPLFDSLSITLHAGDRCLLIGANGAGKTTLLRIIGGKHFLPPHMVRVLGRSAFHDTALTCSGDLCYVGGEWRRDIAFAGFDVPLQMDVSAEKMLYGVSGVDEERRKKLIQVLDVDLSWRMHKVSDGQRRRVQLAMGLLKPFKVLLLDEITVDLDVLARSDLLAFLKSECVDHGVTIIYATHIFDGLESWPSHIAYLARGKLQLVKPLSEIPELKELSLMRTVERWLRKEIEEEKKEKKGRSTVDVKGVKQLPLNNGWIEGRMSSSLAGEESPFELSTNRVLRL